jgi:adenosylmethionine-8-amino-7-oxononanoate aminotransferase
VTPEIFESFLGDPDEHRELAQVSTYGGHPACCAAALANIDIILRERLWENAQRVGDYLLQGLQSLDFPHRGQVRGKGLMIAMELIDEDGSLLDVERTSRVKSRIREEGVLIGGMSHAISGPESVLILSPPLILTESEADQIIDAFRAGLAAV